MSDTISAIVPTIGRAASLRRLLDALAAQDRPPDEVIVADGSNATEIASLAGEPNWAQRGLLVRRVAVRPPNTVRQRQAAIAASHGALLLLLDDDVVPEQDCVSHLLDCLQATGAVAVGADFSDHDWPPPTTLWRWYLRLAHGMRDGEWQGRVVGPLLRFGYQPMPPQPVPMEWIGTGHSLIRRDAYEQCGGFSDFFLHRSTVNEDVDLALKLSRVGPIRLCPAARMAHWQDPSGRASIQAAAEDDLYNRYCVMRYTQGLPVGRATALAVLFFAVETLSGVFAAFKQLRAADCAARLAGRFAALMRILQK